MYVSHEHADVQDLAMPATQVCSGKRQTGRTKAKKKRTRERPRIADKLTMVISNLAAVEDKDGGRLLVSLTLSNRQRVRRVLRKLGADGVVALNMRVADGTGRQGYIGEGTKLSAMNRSSGLQFESWGYVVEAAAFEVVLGIDWIRQHAVYIDWSAMRFNKPLLTFWIWIWKRRRKCSWSEYITKPNHHLLGAFSKLATEGVPCLQPGDAQTRSAANMDQRADTEGPHLP